MTTVSTKQSDAISSASKNRGHSRARTLTISLDQPGRLRVGHIMNLLSLSHSSIYQHIAINRIPKPDGYDPRPYWNTKTIKSLLEN